MVVSLRLPFMDYRKTDEQLKDLFLLHCAGSMHLFAILTMTLILRGQANGNVVSEKPIRHEKRATL